MILSEQQRPGIAKFLFKEFAIRCFGRYSPDLLIKQFDGFEEQKPYGVILYPREDHSGAFYEDRKAFDDLLSQLKGEYNLRVVEVGNKFEVVRALIRLKRKYGPISFAVIGGHGTKDSIKFGDSAHQRNILRVQDLRGRGARRASEFFQPKPTIILVSCFTGIDRGMGQQLSEMIGAKVIAPQIDTSLHSIEPVVKDGQLDFRVRYLKGKTRVYRGGKAEQ